MNELYVFCSEVETVLRALRAVCRLSNRSSPKAILAHVQSLLIASGQVSAEDAQRLTAAATNAPDQPPALTVGEDEVGVSSSGD
jgi:hypothetical protein